MESFYYKDGLLFAEDVSLTDLAEQVGTPCYVYSRSMIEDTWRAYDEAFGGRDHLVCFAVKSNSNIAVLNLLANMGHARFVMRVFKVAAPVSVYDVQNVQLVPTGAHRRINEKPRLADR